MPNPTPSNPAVFLLKEHVPALKNRRQPVPKKGGGIAFQKNPEVLRFMSNNSGLYQRQWSDQCETYDWAMITPPQRVGFFVKLVFYRADKKKLPKSDGDNAYQTLQEMLKNIAILDDNQVAWGNFIVEFTAQRALEGASAWLWLWDEDLDWKTQLSQLSTEVEVAREGVPALIEKWL